jgi:hypothetical protein
VLTIRPEQLKAMAELRRAEVARRLARELSGARPDLFAGGGEAAGAARVADAVDRAVAHGITGARSLRLYVELDLQYDLASRADAALRRILGNTMEAPLVRVRRARALLQQPAAGR